MKWFVFVFVSIVFLVSPYFTGLYSNSSFYSLGLLLFTLFLIVVMTLLFKREINQLKQVTVVLLLPVCYIFSLPMAENPLGAWDSIIQWFTFSTFFILVYWCAVTPKIRKWLPMVFHATGVWIVIYSMLLYIDFIQLRNGFIAGRLGSIFKYPNTFGMVMVVFFFFSLIMSLRDHQSSKEKILYSAPLVVYLLGFFLSFSRGMMIVFPIVWLVGILIVASKKQVKYLLYSMVTVGGALFTFVGLENMNGTFSKTALILGAIFGSVALYLVSDNLLNKWKEKLEFLQKRKFYQLLLPITIILVGLLTILDFANQGLVFKQLPVSMQERIESIDIYSGTAKERLIFNEDALEMSKDSPILGLGGEAFRVLYKKYQQLPYQSNKIHNGYAEWLVDTGWVGLLILLFVIFYLYRQVIKGYQEETGREPRVAVLLATLVIFIHSFLDFNFSYGTVWFLVFWLFAIGITMNSKTIHGKKKEKTKQIRSKQNQALLLIYSIFSILVLCCAVFSYRFMEADRLSRVSAQLKDPIEKQQALEKAIALHPTQVEYWNDLSDVLLKNDKENREGIKVVIAHILALEPNNPDSYLKVGSLSEKINDPDSAIRYYSKALELDHFNSSLYVTTIKAKVLFALEHKDSQDYLKSAIRDYERNTRFYQKFMSQPLDDHDAFNGRDFLVRFESHYYAALAYFLLDDYNGVIEIYRLIDHDPKGEFTALNIVALERIGSYQEALDLYNESKDDYENLSELVETIKTDYGTTGEQHESNNH
ncbi:O-antigen ligase family protein [Bacillus sp. JJ1566]|uniref:O-antigen ligase family protein n=1 Tax=Bacillus sp. JJ1566 TaxID=3122961 RepID=UPI002FFE9648